MTCARSSTKERSLHRLLGIASFALAACGVDPTPPPLSAPPAETSPQSNRVEQLAQTPDPLNLSAVTAVQQAKLLTSDGTDNDHLGWTMTMSGDTILAGTPHDTQNGTAAGSAYVFFRSGGVWSQQQKLLPSDPAEFDYFGESAAISGDTAILSATQDDDLGPYSGSAYVFERSGGVWTQTQKLLPMGGMSADEFGVGVAIDGDTAIVGTTASDNGTDSGSAYVFERSGGMWTQTQKLLPSDGMANAYFGGSIALSGDTAIIGARLASANGAAYVFVRSLGVWTQQAKLMASDGESGESFGSAVELSGDTAVISAPQDDDKGGNSGSVYVFVQSGGVWTQQQKLLASDGTNFDHFGQSIGVSGDVLVAGASYHGTSGNAYLFERAGGVWTEQQILKGSDSALTDFFGSSSAISASTIVVGASGQDGKAPDGGALYVFGVFPSGNPCVMSSECTTGFCVDGVCCNKACGGGSTTDCQACSVAAGALVDGICATLPASVVCRPATGECDKPENCNGVAVTCPANTYLPNGTPCTGGMCLGGVCVSGSSSSSAASSSTASSSAASSSTGSSGGAGGMGGTSGNAGSGGTGGTAGNAGSGGAGGTTGNAGSGGAGGTTGNAGSGGSGGTTGNAGSGGGGGTAGNAGSGGGGTAGNASSSGTGNAGTGGTSTAGSSGNAGSGGNTGQTGDEGGCGCRTVGHPSGRPWVGGLSILGLMLASMRRRQGRRPAATAMSRGKTVSPLSGSTGTP